MVRTATLFAAVAALLAGCVQVSPGASSPLQSAGQPAASSPATSGIQTPSARPSPAAPTGQPSPATPTTGSIAYIRDSTVWLSSVDGSGARQLTSDATAGAYHDPSQAPDGSIYALRGSNTLVHLDRTGRQLATPVTLPTLENGAESLSVSPGGAHVAYVTTGFGTEVDPRFGTPTGSFIYGGTDIATTDAQSVPGAALANMLFPSWFDADTLVVADGTSVYIADVGSHARPWIDTSEGCITEFDCPSGAPVSSSLSAPSVSSAGVVAYVSHPYFGDEGRVFAQLAGAPPALPADGCLVVDQAEHSDPGTFSPDGTRFAFDGTRFDRDEFENVAGEGIFVMTVDLTAADCGASSAELIVPGGGQPDWGALAP
jgi:hypothetical protein